MGIRGLGIAVLILCGWGGLFPAVADDAVYRICSLVRHQEQVDREELELEVELARAHRSAAESIFGLVDRLWESDAVERIVYLAARHERDVAVLDIKRSQLLVQRQEAEIEQLAGICSPLGSDESEEDRRAELEQAGVSFRGHSDTEILVEGCERWGVEATLKRVTGMFGFALWDRQDRAMYLARDRIGEKPLHLGRIEFCDLPRVEPGERPAVVLALAQDGEPAQPGLRAFENQKLEQRAVVVHRHAPLLVVIGEVERVVGDPSAAALARAQASSVGMRVLAAVTGLAHNLGISVCAEGVEDQDTFEFLKTIRCDKMQGFLISEAVMPDIIRRVYRPENDNVEDVA